MKRIIRTIQKMMMIWLGLSILSFGYYLHFTHESHRFLLSQLKEQNQQFINDIESGTLHRHQELQQIFYQLSHSLLLFDFSDSGQKKLKSYIQNEWATTLINNNFIYQLRYVDRFGQEIIRVDNTLHYTRPYIVPDEQLQDQSHTEYFRYAQQLMSGEQGYYGIKAKPELNTPVIQMIYPIEHQNLRLGYFITTLNVMDIVKEITINNQGYDISFINSNGYYVLNNHPEKIFDQHYPQNHSYHLESESPEFWHYIQQNTERRGNFLGTNGLYSFRYFDSTLFHSAPNLLILIRMPEDKINNMLLQRQKIVSTNTLTLQLILGLFAGILSLFWEGYAQKRLENTFNQVVIDNSAAVALTDSRHRILHANIRFCELFEKEMTEIKGKPILSLQSSGIHYRHALKQLHFAGEWYGELQIDHKEKPRTCKVEVRAMKKNQYFVYSLSDISEVYETIQELKEKNDRDPVTALWNKVKFHETLSHFAQLQSCYHEQYPCCLAIIDIDDFKKINDTYGHAIGDQIIHWLANQLKHKLRETDFIARIGGDEFAVIIQNTKAEATRQLMQRLCQTVEHYHAYPLTVSIGIADITTDPQQSFSNADQALYLSKGKGKNCISIYGLQSLSVVDSVHSVNS